MSSKSTRTGSVGLRHAPFALAVVAILAYAVLTANLLLGTLAAAAVAFGYVVLRWLLEVIRLLRRMVVALERIAENS